MKLKVGQILASITDATTVVVIRASHDEVLLTCGDLEMVDPKANESATQLATADTGEGLQLGKRYVDASNAVELLCTRAGERPVTINRMPLTLKTTKPLPASD
jgi:hypothetical protein